MRALLVCFTLLPAVQPSVAFIGELKPAKTIQSLIKLESFKIFSKPRGRVVLDRTTGLYRPEKATPESPTEQKLAPGDVWDSIKGAIYNSVDRVQELPRLFTAQTSDGVVEGYKEVQERVYSSTSFLPSSPGKRILNEYERRGSTEFDEIEPKEGLFNQLQEALSKVIDARRGTKANSDKFDSFIPGVKSSLSDIQDSVIEAQSSSNPVRKALAAAKVRDFERASQDVNNYKASRALKEAIYKAGDTAQWTIDELTKAPAQLSDITKTTASFLRVLPGAFQGTMTAVAAIPSKIQETAKETQESVAKGITTTQQIVDEVKRIPAKVQQSAAQTQAQIEAAQKAVDDTVTQAKVLVGLEKPKPKPPSSPPPKDLTISDIGLKVAIGLTSAAGHVVWWVGKGVVFLTWKGAQKAVEKGMELVKEQTGEAAPRAALEKPEDQMMVQDVQIITDSLDGIVRKGDGPKGATPASIDDQKNLDREVEEALKLAKDAIKFAENSDGSSKQ